MGFADDLKQAEMDVHMASASYEQARKKAENAVRRAEKAHDARMRDIEKNMRSAKKGMTRWITSFEGISLYADRVAYTGKNLKFDAAFRATVDVRGGYYPAGDIGFTRDLRNLFIVIESSDGTIMRECDPDDEKKARDFVALVNATAAKASDVEANARKQLEKLQAELDREEADTKEIEAAKAALEAAKNDTAAVDAARKALEDLKSQASQEELATYQDEKVRNGRKILIGAFIAIIVVVAIVIAFVAKPA